MLGIERKPPSSTPRDRPFQRGKLAPRRDIVYFENERRMYRIWRLGGKRSDVRVRCRIFDVTYCESIWNWFVDPIFIMYECVYITRVVRRMYNGTFEKRGHREISNARGFSILFT